TALRQHCRTTELKLTVTPLACLSSSSLRFWSPHRDPWAPNRGEIAAVIRFNLVCPYAVNHPDARSDISGYAVVRCKPCLPIQGNTGIVTTRSGVAHIEKCFVSEIDTREVGRIRRSYSNSGAVELQTGNHRDRHDRVAKRIVERAVRV